MKIRSMPFKLFLFAIILTLSSPTWGSQEQERRSQAEASLRKALSFMETLQRNGGWAMAWTSDLKVTFGEYRIKPHDIIVVQPPATPSIANVFIRAATVLNEPRYLQTACAAGDALLKGQNQWGGFPHEFTPNVSKNVYGAFDDNVTQGAALFFIRLYNAVNQEKYADGAKICAQFMLTSQYECGGWPQIYPLRKNSYSRYITLNDRAMMDVIRTLFSCYHEFGDIHYYNAAILGADRLLQLQGDPPQSIWAQQYTEEGEPAPARRFEPVAYSSSESMDVLRLMIDVYRETGDKKYLQAGPPAFEWFKRSQLKNGQWARYYQIGSNKPIYSTESGEIIFDVKKARKGYGWQGKYFNPKLETLYEKLLEAPSKNRFKILPPPASAKKIALWPRVKKIMENQDRKGCWLEKLRYPRDVFYQQQGGDDPDIMEINSGTFVRNATLLINYIDTIKNPKK